MNAQLEDSDYLVPVELKVTRDDGTEVTVDARLGEPVLPGASTRTLLKRVHLGGRKARAARRRVRALPIVMVGVKDGD